MLGRDSDLRLVRSVAVESRELIRGAFFEFIALGVVISHFRLWISLFALPDLFHFDHFGLMTVELRRDFELICVYLIELLSFNIVLLN